MSDQNPDGKKNVIDITGLLKKRRNAERKPTDGNEIPPPPPDRPVTRIPSAVHHKGQGNLARVYEAVRPLTELKKVPAVMRAFRALPAWITPDGITYFRAAMLVPIIILLRTGMYQTALVLFVIAQLLDFADGALAKARDCETDEGAFLDPLADKIVVIGTFLALLDSLPGPWAKMLFFLSTSMAVLLTVARIYKRKRPQPASVAANAAGKTKLFLEAIGLSLCILGLAVASPTLPVAGMILCTFAFGLSFFSLVGQLRD